ncbi:hypothetical protein HDU96_004333 [Phlyctochytrium bullatum]|nr:hypothetical protein HDU96_004333 [Phlyctochytrium bullatum]
MFACIPAMCRVPTSLFVVDEALELPEPPRFSRDNDYDDGLVGLNQQLDRLLGELVFADDSDDELEARQGIERLFGRPFEEVMSDLAAEEEPTLMDSPSPRPAFPLRRMRAIANARFWQSGRDQDHSSRVINATNTPPASIATPTSPERVRLWSFNRDASDGPFWNETSDCDDEDFYVSDSEPDLEQRYQTQISNLDVDGPTR